MKLIRLESTDSHYNMAFEQWCLTHLCPDELYFYLWRNAPAVIIGENQDAEAEVNLHYLKENGIALARRVTGGGAVYHDLQNLNYSFVGKAADPALMVEALRKLGVPAELTGRNDIFVEGRKVSGYARRMEGSNLLVHGTLMYDVDLDVLTRALDTPVSKLNRKGVQSVRSRVTNLKQYLPGIGSVEALKDALLDCFPCECERVLSESELAEIDALNRTVFSTEAWVLHRER